MSDNFRKDDIGTNHIKTDLKDNPFSSVVKEAHKRLREAVAEDERRQAEEERRQAEEERRQAEKKRKAKEEREHRRRQEQMDAERKMKGRLTDSIKEAVNSIKPMDLAKDGKIDFKSEAFLWHIQNRISTIRYRPEIILQGNDHQRSTIIPSQIPEPFMSILGRLRFPLAMNETTLASSYGTINLDSLEHENHRIDGHVHSLAISKNGTSIAIGSSSSFLILDSDGQHRKIATDRKVECVEFSPNGDKIAIITNTCLQIHTTKECSLLHNIDLYSRSKGAKKRVSFSPDGRTLAYTEGKFVKLLDLETLTTGFAFKPLRVHEMQYSPGGSYLVIVEQNKISLICLKNDRTLINITKGDIVSAVFIDDSNLLYGDDIGLHHVDLSKLASIEGTKGAGRRVIERGPTEYSKMLYIPEAIKFSDPVMEHVYSINKSGIEQHGFELYTRDGIKFTLSWKGKVNIEESIDLRKRNEGSVFCTPWDEIISTQFNKSDPNSTDDHA